MTVSRKQLTARNRDLTRRLALARATWRAQEHRIAALTTRQTALVHDLHAAGQRVATLEQRLADALIHLANAQVVLERPATPPAGTVPDTAPQAGRDPGTGLAGPTPIPPGGEPPAVTSLAPTAGPGPATPHPCPHTWATPIYTDRDRLTGWLCARCHQSLPPEHCPTGTLAATAAHDALRARERASRPGPTRLPRRRMVI